MDRLQIIVISVIGVIIIVVGLMFLGILPGIKTGGPAKEPVDLLFWGVFDDSDVYQEVIAEFQKSHKNVGITYRKQAVETYERDLINALAAGRGPDILMIHNTWLSKHEDKLSALPTTLMTLKDFQNAFVDTTVEDLVKSGTIYGLPLSVDTLALFYNKDVFNSAGLTSPPLTWENFIEASSRMTKSDDRGNITRAGAALGTSRNVNRASDVLTLLMLQSGVKMTDEEGRNATFDQPVTLEGASYAAGQTALQFYTDFANPRKRAYAWNSQMPYSIDAFAEGRTAMMLNYSYQIPVIKAKSPHLNFGLSFAPQPSGAEKRITFPNYWALSVAAKTLKSQEAWKFLLFLTEQQQSAKYLNKTLKPAARRDLIAFQKTDTELGVFAEQALSAKGWYQVDSAAIEAIFNTMIESVVLGRSTPQEAIKVAADQVTVLMRK